MKPSNQIGVILNRIDNLPLSNEEVSKLKFFSFSDKDFFVKKYATDLIYFVKPDDRDKILVAWIAENGLVLKTNETSVLFTVLSPMQSKPGRCIYFYDNTSPMTKRYKYVLVETKKLKLC